MIDSTVWVGGYRKGSNFVWMSSDRVQEETLVWGPGTAIDTYTDWRDGEPNNFGGNQNYMKVYGGPPSERRYKWDDDFNYLKFKSVVELPTAAGGVQ